MKNIGYLCCETMPSGYKIGKAVMACNFSLSGIQRYIFGRLDFDDTIADIRNNSQDIIVLTNALVAYLTEHFAKENFTCLSTSSGKAIFIGSKRTKTPKLQQTLCALSKEVFTQSGGVLQLDFSFGVVTLVREIPPGGSNAMGALHRIEEQNKFSAIHLLAPAQPCGFVCPLGQQNIPFDHSQIGQENLVAVKLDFDNLGNFFSNIIRVDTYAATSRALDAAISRALAKTPTHALLFCGGDDIYFLCNLADALPTLAQLYRALRQELAQTPALQDYLQHFGLSGGVTANVQLDTRIWFYAQAAEEQLTLAKTHGKNCFAWGNALLSWQEVCFLGEKLLQYQAAFAEKKARSVVDYLQLSWLCTQLYPLVQSDADKQQLMELRGRMDG